MAQPLIIYQRVTQPTPFSPAAESPTIDKFLIPLNLPPHFMAPRRLATGAQQHFAYGPRYDFNPAAQVGWFRALEEPPKPKRSIPAAAQQALAFGPRYDFNPAAQVGWFRALEEPPKPKRSISTPAQQHFAYVKLIESENVKLEWLPEPNQPPKPKRSISTAAQQTFQYQFLVPVPDSTDPGKWWGDLARPPKFLERPRLTTANQQHFAYGPRYDFNPAAQIGWFRQLDEPPAWLKGPRRLLPGQQPSLMMVLHYTTLPGVYLEAADLTIEFTGFDYRAAALDVFDERAAEADAFDERGVYLEGFNFDSDDLD